MSPPPPTTCYEPPCTHTPHHQHYDSTAFRQIRTELHILDLQNSLDALHTRVHALEQHQHDCLQPISTTCHRHQNKHDVVTYRSIGTQVIPPSSHGAAASEEVRDADINEARGGRDARDGNEEVVYAYGGLGGNSELPPSEGFIEEFEDVSDSFACSVGEQAQRCEPDVDLAKKTRDDDEDDVLAELRTQMERLEGLVGQLVWLQRERREADILARSRPVSGGTDCGGNSEAERDISNESTSSFWVEILRAPRVTHDTSRTDDTATHQPNAEARKSDLTTSQHTVCELPRPYHSDIHSSPPSTPINTKIPLNLTTTALQTQNSHLHHELRNYADLHHSLVQDINWLTSTQIELEERLAAVQEERDFLAREVEGWEGWWRGAVGEEGIEGEIETDTSRSSPNYSVGEQTDDEELLRELDPNADRLRNSPDRLEVDAYTQPTAPAHFDARPGYTGATWFEFFPRRSIIVVPGEMPQLYQFPDATSLPEIGKILERRAREGWEDDVYLESVRDILRVRKEMGIELPDRLVDERVVIGIPDEYRGGSLDDGLRIVAWMTMDGDEEEDRLSAAVRGLGIHTDAEGSIDTGSVSLRSENDEDYFPSIGDLLDTSGHSTDYASEADSPSYYECELCRSYKQDTSTDVWDAAAPPLVSVRGGSGRHHRSYFDEFDGEKPYAWLADHQCTTTSPPRSNTNTIPPSNLPQQLDSQENSGLALHPPSASNGDLAPKLRELLQSSNSPTNMNDEHFSRHPKGKGCEEWVRKLNLHRIRCCFCDLAFTLTGEDVSKSAGSEIEEESVRHEDDAPTPWGMKGVGSRERMSQDGVDWKASPFPVVEDPDPRLRGGAVRRDTSDWRPEWYDGPPTTHCVGCQCGSSHHHSGDMPGRPTTFQPSQSRIVHRSSESTNHQTPQDEKTGKSPLLPPTTSHR